jgi:hypothetical protein
MFERTASLWRRLTGRQVNPAVNTKDEVADERRVWVRYPADLTTQYAPATEAEDPSLAARIADISLGGIKLRVDRPSEPGSMLTVTLPGEGSSLTVLACVVHCQSLARGEWALGCSFARELEESDLQGFGARKSRPAVGDDRTWARYPCAVKAFCQPVSAAESEPLAGRVLNISASGMALELAHELPPGTLLSAELHSQNERGVLTILACIVHVSVHSDGRRVTGCNFIRELTESDLQALLERQG